MPIPLPFDDAEMTKFLKSMPVRARRDIAVRAVGLRLVTVLGVLFVPVCLLSMAAGEWMGRQLQAEVAGRTVGFLAVAIVTGAGVTVYKNQKLRRLLRTESEKGFLRHCPVCTKPTEQQPVCTCGCIMAPFGEGSSQE